MCVKVACLTFLTAFKFLINCEIASEGSFVIYCRLRMSVFFFVINGSIAKEKILLIPSLKAFPNRDGQKKRP
jgi:hypothetical protein